jgi:hypothetical protein
MLSRVALLLTGTALAALSCAPTPPLAPCFTIHGDSELRAKDAARTIDGLADHIQLSPEDAALKTPKSLGDLRTILRRDIVYFFANAAAYARTLDTLEGRFLEATFELLLGDTQLLASQVLSMQEAWVGADLRVARANLASEGREPTSDRGRLLVQLIRSVEEGNKIADALGAVAPSHIARGTEVVRRLRVEAPNDVRTLALVAEYHRLRGEWADFEATMRSAEAARERSPALCYLRGMEQLERHRRADQGSAALRQCLATFPRFVRAQAGIVLMAGTPQDSLRELRRLKQMNEDHYLVMLLEPTLAADQELLRVQEGARRAP